MTAPLELTRHGAGVVVSRDGAITALVARDLPALQRRVEARGTALFHGIRFDESDVIAVRRFLDTAGMAPSGEASHSASVAGPVPELPGPAMSP